MKYHDWDEKLQQSHKGYDIAAQRLYELGWYIRPSSDEEQKQGIDGWMIRPGLHNGIPFDVKYDIKAAETHNIAVETVSCIETQKLGKHIHTAATYILIVVPPDTVFITQPHQLIDLLEQRNWRTFHTGTPQGWHTKGKLVPIKEAHQLGALEYL